VREFHSSLGPAPDDEGDRVAPDKRGTPHAFPLHLLVEIPCGVGNALESLAPA